MSSKIKPIKRLYYQFGDLLTVPHLDAYELYEVLSDAELIEGVAFHSPHGAELPTHYRECQGPKTPYLEFLELVQGALVSYCQKHGYDFQRGSLASAIKERL